MIKQFIEQLGGATYVSHQMGLKRSTVAMWGINDGVPMEHRVALVRLSADLGVDLPQSLKDCPVCGNVIVLEPRRVSE